ncbi:MAG: hypothetical protein KBT45_07145 [Bacteroidales bacterium]|nr:hypothetical protein [Candidatus Colimorpha pelethequi]
MEDIANDIDNLDSEDDRENFNNAMEGFDKTTDKMLGYWIGAQLVALSPLQVVS